MKGEKILGTPFPVLGPVVRRHLASTVLASAVLLLVTVPIPAFGDGERISCFAIGWVDPAINPFTAFFQVDPLFTYSVEPIHPTLSREEKRKLDRVYYPRSRDALIGDYDLMVFRNARIDHFTTRQLDDLHFAFSEGEMTSIVTHGPDWDEVWKVSSLYEITPLREYDMIGGIRPYTVRFRREREPVFLPLVELGLEEVWGLGFHTMQVKQGATIWADIVPYGLPWLVQWRPAGGDPGMQWVLPGGFNQEWFGESNRYAIDFATNLILHSLGRQLISDIHSRREARHLISAFQARKVVVLDMADWADSFGADTRELIERLFSIEAGAEEAVDLYLRRDYPAAITRMEQVSSEISLIAEDTVRLKDRALLWVFVSEWLVVTSVAILSGLTVWNLMVRRKKYRQVMVTRLVEP